MARKRFDRAHRAEADKVGFDVVPIRRGFDVVEFDCEDDIPGGIVMAFSGEDVPPEELVGKPAAEGGVTMEERGARAIAATRDLFNAAIVEDQRKLFWEMLSGKHGGMGISQLMDAANYLAEEYSGGRPTGESSASTSPPTSTGLASTAGVSQGVTIYSSSPDPALLA